MRYILCPGYVTSKTDGQRHYITSTQLRQLYRVPHDVLCVVNFNQRGTGFVSKPGDIELHPRYDGNYQLPPLTTKE